MYSRLPILIRQQLKSLIFVPPTLCHKPIYLVHFAPNTSLAPNQLMARICPWTSRRLAVSRVPPGGALVVGHQARFLHLQGIHHFP